MKTKATPGFTARLARANRIAHWMGRSGDGLRLLQSTLSPPLDLGLRLWLAQAFLVSGLLKLTNWDTALALAAYEYPVAWLGPVAAAYLGVAIELVCPVLLALGLATRLAALPLLALSLVIQFEYLALNEHVFWAVLFGWYVVMGAGPLSLDRMIGRGLADTALPFAASLSRALAALTRTVGPLYQFLVRAWLASIFLVSGLALEAPSLLGYQYPAAVLAPGSGELGVALLSLVCPLLLVLGLATRLAAVAAEQNPTLLQPTY